MALTNNIVAEDGVFISFSPFLMEEIATADDSDFFLSNHMFSSVPDISTSFYFCNSHSSSLTVLPPNHSHINTQIGYDVESLDDGHAKINLSPYFCFPQLEAAQKLGIRAQTLSKKWKKAANNKIWPYRSLKRLDCQILTLMKNIEVNPSLRLTRQLNQLVAKRQKLIPPVWIKLS